MMQDTKPVLLEIKALLEEMLIVMKKKKGLI